MSYRNDRDADLARIAALERQLADAKDKLAELERKPPPPPALPPAPPPPAPEALPLAFELAPPRRRIPRRPSSSSELAIVPRPELERALGATTYTTVFPFELASERGAEVMRTIAELAGRHQGSLDLEGPRLMTWTGRGRSIELMIAKGRTRLTCVDTMPRRQMLGGGALIAMCAASMIGAPSGLMLALGGAAIVLFGALMLAGLIASHEPIEMFERAAVLIAQEAPPER